MNTPGNMINNKNEKQRIIDFMQHTSVEVTPGGVAKVPDVGSFLRPSCTVYVAFLGGSDFADTLATVSRLKNEGFNPVPHFTARSIPSAAVLENHLSFLQGEIGVTEALLIGGDVASPVGEFCSSIEVLRTGLFEKYGMQKIGLAGHPEGNPDISPEECALAIEEKNAYAKQSPMYFYLATQFTFEAAPILAWEKTIRAEGNELPVHVGIPGIATIKTLMNHAAHCGIGPSVRFLTRNPVNMIKLSLKDSILGRFVNAPSAEPSKLVRDLLAGMQADPDCLIRQGHLYPLGGLAKSAAWMYKVQDGEFELNDHGFRIIE